MFSKSKDKDTVKTVNAAPAPSKRGKASAPSIFSSDLIVEGSLHSEGDIQIDGRIEGNIRSGSLTVGEKAAINGDIIANKVTVRGRVVGSIRARQVQLSGSSHVEGDILHNSLAVETGAFFDGNCRHAEDPLNAEMPKTMKSAKNAPAAAPMKTKTSNGAGDVQGERTLGRAIPSALTTPHN